MAKLPSFFPRFLPAPPPNPFARHRPQGRGQYQRIAIGDGSAYILARTNTGRLMQRSRNRGSLQAGVDSGQVTAFRPAEHVKPAAAGFIAKLALKFAQARGWIPGNQTMEQGASAAASPSTFALTLYQERYDRRAKMAECRVLFMEDTRINKACWMYAGEAVRGGAQILINGADKQPRGSSGNRINKASEAAREIQDSINPRLVSWACMQIVEGDLFTQAIVSMEGDRWIKAKRMPATSIERLTDDTDEFINPVHAFEQVDVSTNETVASFSMATMEHSRWYEIDGDRYGTSYLMAARRKARLQDIMEEAQAVRRMTRATQRVLYNVGTPDKPTDNQEEIEKFKEDNGFVEGTREIMDPDNIAGDVYANGLVTATSIGSDAHVSDIEDLRYASEVLFAGLPTPGILFAMNLQGISQDVIEGVRAEWLKSTIMLTDKMRQHIKFHFELNLLLRGILPETISYSIHFSESSTETATDIVNRVLTLRRNTIGVGLNAQPDPLISRKKALSEIADFINVPDVDAELALIKLELKQDMQQMVAHQAASAGAMANASGLTASGQNQSGSRTMQKTQTGTPHQVANSGNVALSRGLGGAPKPPDKTAGDSGAFPEIPDPDSPDQPVPETNMLVVREAQGFAAGGGHYALPFGVEYGQPQDFSGDGVAANGKLDQILQALHYLLSQDQERTEAGR